MTNQEKREALREAIADGRDALRGRSNLMRAEVEDFVAEALRQLAALEED